MEEIRYKQGEAGALQEAEALQEAIRELKEAQKSTHLLILNERLNKVSDLLAVVQI